MLRHVTDHIVNNQEEQCRFFHFLVCRILGILLFNFLGDARTVFIQKGLKLYLMLLRFLVFVSYIDGINSSLTVLLDSQ